MAMIAYVLLLLMGLGFAVTCREWKSLVVQLAIPVLAIAWETRPLPDYRAEDHQHLVGMSREEAEAELGTRGAGMGFTRWRGKDRGVVQYQGMTVYYTDMSEDARVVEIVADEW